MQHRHSNQLAGSDSTAGSKRLIVWLLLATCLAAGAVAQDWPQWGRSNERNMYSPQTGLPDRFEPGSFKPGTQEIDMAAGGNLKWFANLGSQSYGNVTVANGRVLVGTNNDFQRDPQHVGDRSILKCFDEETGEFLWQLVVPKLASGSANDWEQLGILSSPTVEGDRVYIVTSRCEVMCLDLRGMANGNTGPFTDEAHYFVQDTGNPPATIGPKDADIIWVYDMRVEQGVFPRNAANSAPLIVGDLVYVCTSNGRDWTHVNIPSPYSPSLIALDKFTGAFAGEDDARIGPRILHGQWSSPSSGVVNGRAQIFFGAGDGWLYAFDPKPVRDENTAWLKTIWRYDANPPEYRFRDGEPIRYPSHQGPSEIIATPMFHNNRVYVAIGQDPEHGEGVGHLVCVDATRKGDVTRTSTVWSFKDIHRSVSTVSIDPETGLLFAGDFSGFIHCLDANTGEHHWTFDMLAHMWGSTLVADGKVYAGNEDGDLVVLAASNEKKRISEVNLYAPIYGSPIVANGVLYIQTSSHLYAFHNDFRDPNSKPIGDNPSRLLER